MKLNYILKNVKIIDSNFEIKENLEINNIAFHTDDVSEGSIFVAIKGYITDGHKFIPKVKDLGAKIAIVEEFSDAEIKQLKVENTRKTLADISANFYNHPSKEMNVIGITATNGKTTTAFMVDKILTEAKKNSGMIGTVLTKYDDTKIPSLLTTPESLTLQKYIRDMKNHKVEYLTMEVSSSAQELYRNRNIDFDIVTFNNLGREHIDQHGSFEKYFQYKSRLIRHAKKDSIAILNADDELIYSLREKTKANVLTFSLENNTSDFGISDLDLSTGMGNFTFKINRDIEIKDLKIPKTEFKINLGSVGYSSVMNSVVAIIISLVIGIDLEMIQRALKNFTGVERRFELIYDNEFKILDDHFANEKNIDSTMSTLKEMKYNNLHILYAIRGKRGYEVNKEIAERLVKWIKILKPNSICATLSRETVTEKDRVTDEELAIFKEILDNENIDYKIYDNLCDSIDENIDILENGDVLLLAGCQGMDKGAGIVLNKLTEDGKTNEVQSLRNIVNNRIC
ncbi:UDP-N-acetylmuramoylalanyl-D-glutamate--2,6-diaminopimelate ligase [Peptoniphilus sp. MSJ-1]|uniref:UDP-N-acetylmuramoylalanyl-D-glutamate--2, 6-diaminopimelate ligase n=1 Tax=Peptoniphilus ovalis TaxID=2841503 RepID=A0ABS6FFS4_9FIRM|nr:Mur ligase family protein [Peptoniphilus ovalis]MBU5669027.1 UDP-N-acetylmuramoylalanyl-D-glutamate--2,6-diaminopimelate ligase [Peptoniphilus ovalis]